MPHSELPEALASGADFGWQMPFAILLLLGLLIAAYRLCIIHTVLENGQVVSKCRWPLSGLIATNTKCIFQQTDKTDCLTPRMKIVLSQVFNGQAIAFGMFVYCLGVCLATLATMQLGNSPVKLSPAHTTICIVLGIAAMTCGAFVVIMRKQNNPFTEKELEL